MFLKEKFRPDGVFERLRARLVAGGNQQGKTIYMQEDPSSPTVNTSHVLLLMAITAHEALHFVIDDLASAYINALTEGIEVLMIVDPASPVTQKLFEVDPSSPLLPSDQSEIFHSRVAKLL